MDFAEKYTIYDEICEYDNEAAFIYLLQSDKSQFSEMFKTQFGLPGADGKPSIDTFINLVAPIDRNFFKDEYTRCVSLKKHYFSIGFYAFDKNGNARKLYMKSAVEYDSEGYAAALKGIIFNLTESDFCSHCNEEQAYIDKLTGLPNMKSYSRDMSEILKKKDSKGHIITIAIDNINDINMMYSYAAGEKVIWHVGQKLPALMEGRTHRLYHVQTEQYLLILPEADMDEATYIMIKIRAYFKREMLSVDANKIRITLSSAAVAYFGKLDTFDRLLLNAKVVIDKIRDSGNDNYGTYTRGDGILYTQQLELVEKIKEAVENGCKGFMLYYQPIFSVYNGQCAGAEALIRWFLPEKPVIPPSMMIPILEKTGLMPEVERWLLNEACAMLKRWKDMCNTSKDFFVHVNLSPKQITRDTLTQEVMDAIETNGISPHNLILETTETSMMLELDKGVKLPNELRHKGVRIAVDDFGTGYSSLSYLRTLPVDEIKIDRSFVNGIEDDIQSRNFLIGRVKIIQSMQYTVCVEGIETKGQKDILTGLQVDMLQGYLFDKPVPADEFEVKYIAKA